MNFESNKIISNFHRKPVYLYRSDEFKDLISQIGTVQVYRVPFKISFSDRKSLSSSSKSGDLKEALGGAAEEREAPSPPSTSNPRQSYIEPWRWVRAEEASRQIIQKVCQRLSPQSGGERSSILFRDKSLFLVNFVLISFGRICFEACKCSLLILLSAGLMMQHDADLFGGYFSVIVNDWAVADPQVAVGSIWITYSIFWQCLSCCPDFAAGLELLFCIIPLESFCFGYEGLKIGKPLTKEILLFWPWKTAISMFLCTFGLGNRARSA
ncbi:hypothetical protein DM860_015511 [Cuscuta australis]|uniref:Uncharacterized protein n=1 Tax=Cuscuta australis TaxID=267555 RepID=A0A328DGZ5_9ASTE|nr:hypothetical protein DM860_015511 [Cuscuta australis]